MSEHHSHPLYFRKITEGTFASDMLALWWRRIIAGNTSLSNYL